MHDHVRTRKQLAVYRCLSAAEREEADKARDSCLECVAIHVTYQVLDAKLRKLPDQSPKHLPRTFAEVLAGSRGDLTRRFRFRGGLIAAGVLALVGVTLWLAVQVLPPNKPVVAETPSVTPTSISTTLAVDWSRRSARGLPSIAVDVHATPSASGASARATLPASFMAGSISSSLAWR